ncbi:PKD domain-containing protein, partial [Pelomonas sp. Root1217]|uniref:PKD domain-containing protein n=1 Tax=Pelomonas sp. Root1217 TaxID=1736430 RepID=UPI00070E68D1
MSRLVKQLFAALLFLSLAACGGGGSDEVGGGSGPTHTPPTATIANVQPALAGATITLDGSGSTAAAGLTLSYNWVLTSKPTGSVASLQNASSAKPSLSTDLPGDYLLTLTVNDGQLSSTPSTRTVTVLQAFSIQTSPEEPLSGTVTFSLSGYTPGIQMAWYLDQALIASGASVSWDSTKVANGSHVVTAWLEVEGKISEIRRTVEVANSPISLSASTTGSGPGSSDSAFTRLNVSASSPGGITSVAASLDGKPLGVLTSMNACTGRTCSVPNVYQFVIENKTIISGEHVA